jgi:hypothetical protein
MKPPKRAPKRQKKESLRDLAVKVWGHYQSYLESLKKDPTGDIDELEEILDVCKDYVHPINNSSNHLDSEKHNNWNSVEDLLSVLISVCYFHLAESSIAEYLVEGNATNEGATHIQELLTKSFEYYPQNAATWSMGANFGRMTHLLSLSTARQWYERAAEYASRLRSHCLDFLGSNDKEDLSDDMLNDWVELLVLNQVAGVEFYEDEEETDSTTNQEDSDHDADVDTEDDEHASGNEEQTTEGVYSASAVEETSRFMCAMLASLEGRHDLVPKHLMPFGLTHRLHPNVWKPTLANAAEVPTKAPAIFDPKGGILPNHLYEAMKEIFAPESIYWQESNYMARDYYSFFMDYDRERNSPNNLIEDVIVNHLLPRAKQLLSKEEGDSICGFEWWAHTRPIRANLGHNLHFDTDEAILAQEGRVTHPILSSILYLTGGGVSGSINDSRSGSTLILDQIPDAKEVAAQCWKGRPVDNAFLLFPGNLLHGVLPCPGKDGDFDGDHAEELEESDVSSLWKRWKRPEERVTEEGTRLTFMVGFWTRNVPASMKERRLYGPCGPIPPPSEEHTWVQEIMKRYNPDADHDGHDNASPVSQLVPSALPHVSPAWETIPIPEAFGEDDQLLVIPRSIDHRFFVKGAPACFYDSLFSEKEHSLA